MKSKYITKVIKYPYALTASGATEKVQKIMDDMGDQGWDYKGQAVGGAVLVFRQLRNT